MIRRSYRPRSMPSVPQAVRLHGWDKRGTLGSMLVGLRIVFTSAALAVMNLSGCGSIDNTCSGAANTCRPACAPIAACPAGKCGTIDNGCGTGTLTCAECAVGQI